MKETPILFSGSMIRAILENRKSQTRRIMKPQPSEFFTPSKCMLYEPAIEDDNGEMVPGLPIFGCYDINGENEGYECKWGRPGDLLRVKETALFQRCDGKPEKVLHYAADGYESTGAEKWTPSIYTPTWACRIKLEITGVRAERLNDISEADAKAEGINCTEGFKVPYNGSYMGSAEDRFQFLWESINGKGSWALNPFVWAISFRRIKP